MGFPDPDWCTAAIERLNADPDMKVAADGWVGDFGLIIDDQGVYLGPPNGGRLPPPEFCSVEALRARRPAYLAQASTDDWRALMTGELDPIAAIVQRKLMAQGDLTPVIARLNFRGLAERWLAHLKENP